MIAIKILLPTQENNNNKNHLYHRLFLLLQKTLPMTSMDPFIPKRGRTDGQMDGYVTVPEEGIRNNTEQ